MAEVEKDTKAMEIHRPSPNHRRKAAGRSLDPTVLEIQDIREVHRTCSGMVQTHAHQSLSHTGDLAYLDARRRAAHILL